MPIRVNIDEMRRLVEVVVTGELTEADFRDAMDRHFPEAGSSMPLGLFDLSEVTATNVSGDSVRDAARRAATVVDPRVEDGRLAIVGQSDVVLALGRIYEILRRHSSVEVRVFRERDEAELWLGIAKEVVDPENPGR